MRKLLVISGIIILVATLFLFIYSKRTKELQDDKKSQPSVLSDDLQTENKSDEKLTNADLIPQDNDQNEDILDRVGELGKEQFIRDIYGILDIETKPLPDPGPLEILVRPTQGDIYAYKSLGYTLTEEEDPEAVSKGEHDFDITNPGDRDLYDNGIELFEVTSVNDDGSFELDLQRNSPRLISLRGKIQEILPPEQDIELMISSNNKVLNIRVDGQLLPEATRAVQMMPSFEFPREKISIGHTSTSISESNPENSDARQLIGYEELNGYKCAVFSTKGVVNINVTNRVKGEERELHNCVTITGLCYVDYETGITVREDMVMENDARYRALGSDDPFEPIPLTDPHPLNNRMVRQILSKADTEELPR